MLANILVGLLAAAISGSVGFFVSRNFWRSTYAATNKSGDFGAPRGGFFALMSGMFVGMLFFSLLSHIVHDLPIDVGFITSMVVGSIAGVAGMFSAKKNSGKNDEQNKPKDANDKNGK